MAAPNPIQLDYSFSPTVHLLVGELETFGLTIRSFHEPLKRSIQKVMAPSFKKNFDLGGRPPWQELKDETLQQKTYVGGSGTLVRTGTLRKVAQQLNLWKIGQEEATIQEIPSRADYGAIHQEGTATIPQREWAVIQPEDMDAIEEIFADWIAERLMAVGFTRGLI